MNGTMKTKVYRTELRFRTKAQHRTIKAIAKKNGRNMNAEILIALDNHINSFKENGN